MTVSRAHEACDGYTEQADGVAQTSPCLLDRGLVGIGFGRVLETDDVRTRCFQFDPHRRPVDRDVEKAVPMLVGGEFPLGSVALRPDQHRADRCKAP